jgi:hypothetical protein
MLMEVHKVGVKRVRTSHKLAPLDDVVIEKFV